jgi:hypothetical protein
VLSPPRHQGHQAHPPTLSNAKTQRRKDAKPTHLSRQSRAAAKPDPPLSQRRGAETQRRRESCRRLHRTARFRPSGDGREPLGRTTAPNTSVRHGGPAQRPALRERRPRRFSFPFNSWEMYTSLPIREEARQNRRAKGASASEKRSGDERSRSELASFSPATGDHPIACRSAVNPRDRLSCSASTSLRLCVFAGRAGGWALRSLRFYGMGGWIWVHLCDLWANLGGWAALRLCGSASLRSFWCSPLESWCLGGSKFLASLA